MKVVSDITEEITHEMREITQNVLTLLLGYLTSIINTNGVVIRKELQHGLTTLISANAAVQERY